MKSAGWRGKGRYLVIVILAVSLAIAGHRYYFDPSSCLAKNDLHWAEKKWSILGPSRYFYSYSSSGAFSGMAATVWVDKGRVTRYTLDKTFKNRHALLSDFQTIPEIFQRLETSIPCDGLKQSRHQVQADYHPVMGYPRHIKSDWTGLLDAWSVTTIKAVAFTP